ncbi:MAG: hypothetical protein FJZ92_13605 [Chloroflexi bacterium]|nr:hypothetical protein [Chloroflexota bacterium]
MRAHRLFSLAAGMLTALAILAGGAIVLGQRSGAPPAAPLAAPLRDLERAVERMEAAAERGAPAAADDLRAFASAAREAGAAIDRLVPPARQPSVFAALQLLHRAQEAFMRAPPAAGEEAVRAADEARGEALQAVVRYESRRAAQATGTPPGP